MYAYVAGSGYDIQSDFAKIPTSHNYFPAPQSFTLIREIFLFFYFDVTTMH
jgi:hypothetical protein